jgi:hypothetical protein
MADPETQKLMATLEAISRMGPPKNALLDPAILAAIAGARGAVAPSSGLLNELLDTYRSRSSWNDRFSHWERPETVSEEGTIERAQKHVRAAIGTNTWLNAQNVTIHCQGSYNNRTNVRTEADIDLRAEHPGLRIDYASDVVQQFARPALTYVDLPMTLQQIFDNSRANLKQELDRAFGAKNVDGSGTKAFRIKGITGSRAEVDVVPTVGYHYVTYSAVTKLYSALNGVAILSTDGKWTINYPEQHAANGIAKRARTAHRFKKMVRIFKRMRADMKDRGLISVGVPSFLVECLVYEVEDSYFLVESDDAYDRVRRIARRMKEKVDHALVASNMKEINGIKPLWGGGQSWSRPAVQEFINVVVSHLGNA